MFTRACRRALDWIDELVWALPLLVTWCLFVAAGTPHL